MSHLKRFSSLDMIELQFTVALTLHFSPNELRQ